MRLPEMTGQPRKVGHKTLVIHIGDHKTGSTSIQLAFAQGHVKLAGRSVFYPTRLSHNMLKGQCQAYWTPDKPVARKRAITVFQKLANRIQASEADFCLLSAEELEEVDPNRFPEIVARYFANAVDEIRVVAYVRPHAARLLSSFAELTKIGAVRSGLEPYLQHALDKRRFHYQPRFAAWQAAFGEAFMLRPMIRDQLFGNSVVHDFIHHGFGESGFQVEDTAIANESLCLEDLMRLKVLQSRCMGYEQKLRHALGWEFTRVIGTLPPSGTRTRLTLHKALARDIYAAYLEDARSFDQQFMGGVPLLETELERAVDAAPQAAQSVEPEDHLSPSEIRSLHLLSDIIAGMLGKKGNGRWAKFLSAKWLPPGSESTGAN